MKKNLYRLSSFVLILALLFSSSAQSVSAHSDVKISSRFYELLFKKEEETKTLTVGGNIFGVKIKQSYVTVAEAKSVSKLHAGDILLSINGERIGCCADAERVIKDSSGEIMDITVRRGGEELTFQVKAKYVSGEYKLGIKLKESACGIGTVTFIDKETGTFGGLGHGICDPDTGDIIKTEYGDVTDVLLGGVTRGEAGRPGELSGILTGKTVGKLLANTECGIFGTLSDEELSSFCGEELPVGTKSDVHAGEAYIISTVKNGEPRKFSIEITELCDSASPTKCFKVKVTDKTLIALTGGIVRGMSGSPIIQDGKLVGAVTHVMVADPTEGYGIFIENMLNAANQQIQPKAA